MESDDFLGNLEWDDFLGDLHEKPLGVIEIMLSYLPTACKIIAILKDENLLATGKMLMPSSTALSVASFSPITARKHVRSDKTTCSALYRHTERPCSQENIPLTSQSTHFFVKCGTLTDCCRGSTETSETCMGQGMGSVFSGRGCESRDIEKGRA